MYILGRGYSPSGYLPIATLMVSPLLACEIAYAMVAHGVALAAQLLAALLPRTDTKRSAADAAEASANTQKAANDNRRIIPPHFLIVA
jgi:hypothetical protein